MFSASGSTFHGNTANTHGAGLHLYGGALTNCTVYGNHAEAGGGGGVFTQWTTGVTFTHCTIAGNTAATGGGGINVFLVSSATLTNCVVAGNTATTGSDLHHSSDENSVGGFVSEGVNFVGIADGVIGLSADDITGTAAQPADPMMHPFGDHGGFTLTSPPTLNSPLINAVPMASHDPDLIMDQRGRQRVIGDGVDIGSVEVGNYKAYNRWALETIPPDKDRNFTGDADNDGDPNGFEFGVGSHATESDVDSNRKLSLLPRPGSDEVDIEFGFRPDDDNLIWCVERSNNLGEFVEIYRLEKGQESMAPNVDAQPDPQDPSRKIVTDRAPHFPRCFYQLVILQSDNP